MAQRQARHEWSSSVAYETIHGEKFGLSRLLFTVYCLLFHAERRSIHRIGQEQARYCPTDPALTLLLSFFQDISVNGPTLELDKHESNPVQALLADHCHLS
jgi:hypothetical protein